MHDATSQADLGTYSVCFALISDCSQCIPLMRLDLPHRVPEQITQLQTASVIPSHECPIHQKKPCPGMHSAPDQMQFAQ